MPVEVGLSGVIDWVTWLTCPLGGVDVVSSDGVEEVSLSTTSG